MSYLGLVPQRCPGPCNAAWRQAEAARDDRGRPVPHVLTASDGDPIWCWRCARNIAARLAALDDLIAMIEAELAGRRGSDDDHITGSRGRPSPSTAVDDVDEITRTLESWESAYRDLRRLPARPPRAQDLRVTMCIRWLSQHLTGALGSALGRDLGEEIQRLHLMARRSSGTNPERSRRPAPCPRCERKWLTHYDGDGYIRCENATCGRIMTMDEYDAYALSLARGIR